MPSTPQMTWFRRQLCLKKDYLRKEKILEDYLKKIKLPSVVINHLQKVNRCPGDLSRVKRPLRSPHQRLLLPGSIQGEETRFIKGEGLRRQRLLQVPRSRMAWLPASSLSKRHKPIRGPVGPQEALSKGTALPGSKPRRDALGNTREHQRTTAWPHPRGRWLLRSRAPRREGCGLGAVRASRCKPSQGQQVINICTPKVVPSRMESCGQGAVSVHQLPSATPSQCEWGTRHWILRRQPICATRASFVARHCLEGRCSKEPLRPDSPRF